MFFGEEAELPGMGLPSWASLLVYQRDHMSWRKETKLAREDEGMPTMRGIPIIDTSVKSQTF